MIFSAIQTLEEFNKTGIDNVLVYIAGTSSAFVPMFLFSFWLIIVLGTFFGTKRFTGQSDFFASMAVASFATFTVTLMMTLKEGLVNGTVFVTVMTITAISAVLLHFSRER